MRLGVVLGAVSLLLLASPASALVLNSCTAGCFTNTGLLFNVDYTIPPDGHAYRWDLWTSNPDVTVNLYSPNQVETIDLISNGNGTYHSGFGSSSPPYTFQFAPGPTGHSYYTVSAPANFNNCNAATPAGQVCGEQFDVFGNGGFVTLSYSGGSVPPVTVFFGQSLVPEPRSWALAILGLGATGAMLRRRRAAALAIA